MQERAPCLFRSSGAYVVEFVTGLVTVFVFGSMGFLFPVFVLLPNGLLSRNEYGSLWIGFPALAEEVLSR